MSDAMKAALGALTAVTDQALEYREGISGGWTPLTGGFLQAGPAVVIGYDDNRRAIMAPMSARLKVKVGNDRLIPGTVADNGYQVRDGGDNGVIWGVIGASHTSGQSLYELQRNVPQSAGDDRGGP